ncbi:hypothetical protein GOODEAATRI_004691 [Goodea atripinnis]|uniref:Uncharacterized protein n=1 Tax=Goodea atripinnis TaxID=208336 RepID=A0ABV0NHH8_9TELE
MDGSGRRAVVNSSLGWPGGIAVDILSERIFWTDEKLGAIGSSTLDGNNIKMRTTTNPFSVAVFNDMLYWSDAKKRVVQAANKLSGKNRQVILKRPGQPFAVKIYLQAQQATGLKGWPEHLALQIPSVSEAKIMDYSIHEHTLILTDDSTTSVNSFKLKDSILVAQGQLLKLLDDQITAMALDWVTLNVYWSSNKQSRLHVTSKTGAYTAILIKEGITGVGSIALHPQSGRVCFTNLDLKDAGSKAVLECAHMDGGEHEVVWKEAVQPASLVFSSNGDTIYWANTVALHTCLKPSCLFKVLVSGMGQEPRSLLKVLRAPHLLTRSPQGQPWETPQLLAVSS